MLWSAVCFAIYIAAAAGLAAALLNLIKILERGTPTRLGPFGVAVGRQFVCLLTLGPYRMAEILGRLVFGGAYKILTDMR